MRAISATLTAALVWVSFAAYMLQSFRRKLPQPGSVFVDQSGTNQILLRDLGHCAGRQAEDRGNDVQAARPLGQDRQILPLGRSEAQVVDLLKLAGPLEMRGRMAFSPSALHTRRQACSRRRARRGVPRDRWAIMGSTFSSMFQAKRPAPRLEQQVNSASE